MLRKPLNDRFDPITLPRCRGRRQEFVFWACRQFTDASPRARRPRNPENASARLAHTPWIIIVPHWFGVLRFAALARLPPRPAHPPPPSARPLPRVKLWSKPRIRAFGIRC